MSGTVTLQVKNKSSLAAHTVSTTESPVIRRFIIATALTFLLLFLILPLFIVFHEAFSGGISLFLQALNDPDAIAAIRLTLITAAIVVPANLVFGVCAAWAISKFKFRGKSLLITLIDLPFAVSPVIAGLIFILIFGSRGWL